MSKLVAAVSLLCLCACAGSRPVVQDPARETVKLSSEAGAPQPEGKMLCRLERRTGSNIPERICRYVNQNEFDAARAQDMLHLMPQRQVCNDMGCVKSQ
jgi:hypothetical protein